MAEFKLSRRDFVSGCGTAMVGTALIESAWASLPQRPAPINQQVQAGRVFVKSVMFTAKIQKVSIHKFQQKCTLQLGDPDNRLFGIYFHADVVLDLVPNTKGKADFGILGTIQNVNFLYKRTPPLKTAKGFTHECASS